MAQVYKKDVTVSGGSFNAIEDRVMQSSAISNSKYAKNNKFMIFDSENKMKVTASSTDLTIGIGKAILCGCLFDNDVVATLTPSRPNSSTAKAYLCLAIDLNGTTGQKQFFEDILGDISNFPVLQKDDLTETVGIKHQVALASYTIDSNGFITNFVDMTPGFVGEGSDALPKTGGAMTGDIDMQGHQITEADMGSIQQRDNFIRITLDPPDFTQGVANEKFTLKLPAIYYTCELRIKAMSTFSHDNSAGVMEKTFNIMLQPTGALNMNRDSYTNVEGNVIDYLDISTLTWNASESVFEIKFSKLISSGNVGSLALILEFEGLLVPTLEQVKQIRFGPVYTTDPTIPPKPVLQTRGNEIWHAGNAGILVNDKMIGYDDTIHATTLVQDILKDLFDKSQAVVGTDKPFELTFTIRDQAGFPLNFTRAISTLIEEKYGTTIGIATMKFKMEVSTVDGGASSGNSNSNKCSVSWDGINGAGSYYEWYFDYDNWSNVIVRDAKGNVHADLFCEIKGYMFEGQNMNIDVPLRNYISGITVVVSDYDQPNGQYTTHDTVVRYIPRLRPSTIPPGLSFGDGDTLFAYKHTITSSALGSDSSPDSLANIFNLTFEFHYSDASNQFPKGLNLVGILSSTNTDVVLANIIIHYGDKDWTSVSNQLETVQKVEYVALVNNGLVGDDLAIEQLPEPIFDDRIDNINSIKKDS